MIFRAVGRGTPAAAATSSGGGGCSPASRNRRVSSARLFSSTPSSVTDRP